MGIHLVTVIALDRRVDLAIPGDIPVRELIPEIVNSCIDVSRRDASARWALMLPGANPLDPDDRFDTVSVLDGTILYLRDMTKPAPAMVPSRVTLASSPPRAARDAMGRPLHEAAGATVDMAPRNRWNVEPAGSLVATGGAAIALFAIWLLVKFAGGGSLAVGLLLAALVVAAYIATIWWMGWSDWFAQQTGLGLLRRLPPPRGLAKHS